MDLDPDHILKLTKQLIEIHRKWIIDGVSDAEDVENENAGIREQQAVIEAFAAQRSLPECVRSKLYAGIYEFLNGGLTGDGDGPLVEDVAEDTYPAFAVKLSTLLADG